MSNPYPRHSGLSYANVAAGTIARAARSGTPSQIPIAATYSYHPQRSVVPDILQMSRQERRYSVRAELDAGEPVSSASWRRQSNGALLRYDDQPSYTHPTDDQPFFIPSYLKRSRHVQRLQEQWEEHAQTQQAQSDIDGTSKPFSSSTTSSATNLSRVRSSSPGSHMHRGVAQHVIERPPLHYTDHDGRLRPLPTRWSDHDKAPALEVLADGSEVRFGGVALKQPDDAASIRTDNPIPKELGLYYYEVTIMSRGKDAQVGVGFVPEKTMLSRLPGWEADAFAYHGDDGNAFSGSSSGRSYGPHFSSQDVIGCGINFRANAVFFTKNGVFLGNAFSDIKTGYSMYPCIGLKKPSDHVRVNFGRQPFLFDIDSMQEHEHQLVLASINQQPVDQLHPPDDEISLIQNLIGQYLAHEGYVETSRAFQHDLRERRRLAPSTANQPATQDDADDDIYAIHRQKIRRTILDGEVDRALKYTTTFFPSVLEDQRNKEIKFRLRCRKFIEMMRQWSDLSSKTNGHSAEKDAQPDTQMELDDQIQREATMEDDDMDLITESQDLSTMQEGELFNAAVAYGTGLQKEFGSDPSAKVKKELADIFALLCYPDPRSSPLGYLLDKSGRSSIAEELNGAILVSLGKPSSAALEKLCSQTESYLDDVTRKHGGAAAFVNVRQDFLHA